MRYQIMKTIKCCDNGSKEVGEILGYAARSNLNSIFICLMEWKEQYSRMSVHNCKCDAQVVIL